MIRPGRQAGFSLIEVLVALVIAGLTATMFLELLSGSVNLEFRGRRKLETALAARQVFDDLLRQDVRDQAFPWKGTDRNRPWVFSLVPMEVERPRTARDEGPIINLPSELYEYVLTMYEDEREKSSWVLRRQKAHPKGWFSEDFKRNHLPDLVTPGAKP